MPKPPKKIPKWIGSLRSSQTVTTYGPGALVDLPDYSAIVAGLDDWRPRPKSDQQINEPRLSSKIQSMMSLPWPARLFPPPPADEDFWPKGGSGPSYVAVRRFPKWFVVQVGSEQESRSAGPTGTSRRLVHWRNLDGNGRYEKKRVVATRFVRACRRGHVDDLDWRRYVHGNTVCLRPLWLDHSDLSDLVVRCECGKRRRLAEALEIGQNTLGPCSGRRPWLGPMAAERCQEPSRLLVRTATNAYFPQVVRVLSIPETMTPVDRAIDENWEHFKDEEDWSRSLLKQAARFNPAIRKLRSKFSDDGMLRAIEKRSAGASEDLSVKQLEINAFVNAPEGYGGGIPIDDNFHARKLPGTEWRKTGLTDFVDRVVQLHRLREVSALVGFTRFEAAMPDINGEYDTDVTRAALDERRQWFPAIENRGEGIFLSLDPEAVEEWSNRPEVKARVRALRAGHRNWREQRKGRVPGFPGGAYVLLHTLSHLLMQSVAIRCGYPATAIRERIYLGESDYGILLYTASTDADGTLGGLVQQARDIEIHLKRALGAASLCSSDPICAQHTPERSLDARWLHGAACHSCSLIAETSCEMQNEFLDRALVVSTIDTPGAAFFGNA